MRMNEIGNVYDFVFHENPTSFKSLNKLKTCIKKEFIHGGHVLALGSSLVAVSVMILNGMILKWEFLPIIYLITLCIYNFDHYREMEKDFSDNLGRVNHLFKYKKILPILITTYGISSITLLIMFGNLESIIFGIVFLSMGIVYSYKVKKLTSKILAFKNFYTASAVALSALFTVIYCGFQINWLFFVIFVFLFLRFFVNTSFCDIKDMQTDKKHGILTLPLFFGKNYFLKLLHIINLLSFVVLISAIILEILPAYSIFLVFVNIYCFYYIKKSKCPKINITSLSDIIVDGEFIFWPIFLIIGKSVFMIL